LKTAWFVLITVVCSIIGRPSQAANSSDRNIKVVRFLDGSSAEISVDGHAAVVRVGGRTGNWALMEIAGADARKSEFVILEDFTSQTGHLLVVDTNGVRLDLPKSAEPTSAAPATLYLGHSLEEIKNSASDLLGDQILSKHGDPDYDEVAGVLPPISKMPTYSFVGANETMDKVGFAYGGRSPNFDPAPYDPATIKIREQGKVLDGLVGGYLPVLRFVYPETSEAWTEMLAFAPLRIVNENDRVQPVWYRIVHVENGVLKWSHYIDSYHPFPPRTEYDPKLFYQDLVNLNDGWQKTLAPAMKISVPDERLENMARFGLVRDLMTRIHHYPKYGAVDKDYAGSEHDGFPDTFNVDTTAMLEWGLAAVAERFIDNYFDKFVRDDGSILYRGPETGQYGRMLTVVAQYANYGSDVSVLIKHRGRIDGVARLLLGLREKAKQLPRDNPAYGLFSGWSEADASLDADPPRYMQPYFSNSSEAARGFRDLGQVWSKIGRDTRNAELTSWGDRLVREADELSADLQKGIAKSLLQVDGETILPAIAGVKDPFHVAVARDQSDPQFRSYRAYMEMMDSGILTKEQVNLIVRYRAKHHDTILGVPTVYGYNTGILAGFLAYGTGYGLIQHDSIPEALLLTYAVMAHQYTRGTWTAPETRPVFVDNPAAPYCTPAQLVVPLLTKWMLVFEDPMSETMWLGKAMPRNWLEDGKTSSVSSAPTRWGKVGFSIVSHLREGQIAAIVDLPVNGFTATTKLRLRTPGQRPMKSVLLDGKPWTQFDSSDETITIPAGARGRLAVVAQY
jgi:hypothetical protein